MSAPRLSIGYLGDGKWAHEAFKLLLADEALEVRFVVVRNDHRDPVLAKLAEDAGLPVLFHPSINAPDFLARLRESACDLLVSMSFNQIFRKEILSIPPCGIINCHAGMLPFYRGRNILNWALINDEKTFGITVHYVDEGVDTGDIILQDAHPITDADDYSTLLERAHRGCAGILYRAIDAIRRGEAPRRKQAEIHPVGFYCGMRREGDEVLVWRQTSRDVFNFVRAVCRPGPQARCRLAGQEMKINKVRQIPGAPAYRCVPGMVVGRSKESFTVKTLDATVEVLEWEYAGKVRVGDRLE